MAAKVVKAARVACVGGAFDAPTRLTTAVVRSAVLRPSAAAASNPLPCHQKAATAASFDHPPNDRPRQLHCKSGRPPWDGESSTTSAAPTVIATTTRKRSFRAKFASPFAAENEGRGGSSWRRYYCRRRTARCSQQRRTHKPILFRFLSSNCGGGSGGGGW